MSSPRGMCLDSSGDLSSLLSMRIAKAACV